MPKIQPQDRTANTLLTVSIRTDIHTKLRAYASFLSNSDVSYVVSEALKPLFADKEFTDWLKTNPLHTFELKPHSKPKPTKAAATATAA